MMGQYVAKLDRVFLLQHVSFAQNSVYFTAWSCFKMVIVQGSTHSGPVLTPEEALIAIHGIDPDRDGIPLKKAKFHLPFIISLFQINLCT